MARRFRDLIAAMPEARQRRIRQRTGELLADLPLQEMRARELTRGIGREARYDGIGAEGRGADRVHSRSGRSLTYAVVIERSGTGFAAWVPDLPGCVATAETEEELRRMIKEAIEFHADGLKESGQPVPGPSTAVEYVDVSVTR